MVLFQKDIYISYRYYDYNNIYLAMKNKNIVKASKKTRSHQKNDEENEPIRRNGHNSLNSQKKGKKSHVLRAKLENVRNSSHHISESQKIVVDLNLGQYGFDSPVIGDNAQNIEELLKNCEYFAINPNLHTIEWRQICYEVARVLESENYLIETKNRYYFYCTGSGKLIEISKEENILLECMHQLLTKIKNGTKSPGLRGAICGQTEYARQILEVSNRNLQKFQEIEKRNQMENFCAELDHEIAWKTFRLGLNVMNIDELNYFLAKEFEENSRLGKQQGSIENWLQWTQFIQKKRVRLRKAHKFLLHTACQLCLSPYSQKMNPMINCPECHIRGHRLCLGLERANRCGRCVYIRLSNQLKQRIPQCFICNTKNLAPLKIGTSKFAHVFCLIASKMWKINNSCIDYSPVQEKPETKVKECRFCKKETPYYTKCIACQQPCHFMCAYMNGSCFEIKSDYTVNVFCCKLRQDERGKLQWQRKYILNYNSIVFKKLGQIIRENKKRRKKRTLMEKQKKNVEEKQEPQEQFNGDIDEIFQDEEDQEQGSEGEGD